MTESKRYIHIYSTGEIEKCVDIGLLKYNDKISIDDLAKFIYYGKLYYIYKWKECIPSIKLKKKGDVVIIKAKYELFDENEYYGEREDEVERKYPYTIEKLIKYFTNRIIKLKEKANEYN